MGFVKTNEEIKKISEEEAKELLKSNNVEDLLKAVETLIDKRCVLEFLLTLNEFKYKPVIDFVLSHKEYKKEDKYLYIEMLKSDNAYLRNEVIVFLREKGDIEEIIDELLNSPDIDLRIFGINILGDSKLENTREILKEFIKKEKDVNAIITAVDYLGEIGEKEDIKLLEELKSKFDDDFLNFSVDLAIRKIND